MRRYWWLTAGLALATTIAIIATAGTELGVPLSDYNITLLVLAVALPLSWRVLKRRRVTSHIILWSGILAVASGFLLLYLKDDLKTTGLKDLAKYWHSATSILLMVAFLAHWALNHARLNDFTKRLLGRVRTGAPLVGAWAGGLAVGALTWTASGRVLFTEENYLLLSGWAILVGVTFAYALWLIYRFTPAKRSLEHAAGRNTARSLVDTSLWMSFWLATLTGFLLLYGKEFLHGNGFKYVSKWWHTSTSVAFVALVVLHIGFNARILAAHARRLEHDLRK